MVKFTLSRGARDYQSEAFEYARQMERSVVCLPTGTGKTLVGILFLRDLFESAKIERALILEPTRFLVSQVAGVYEYDAGISPVPITGSILPEERKRLWKNKTVVATPQCAFNDRNLWVFDAVVIDECHHTTGLHAYAELMKVKKFTYKLGLSATIPSSREAEISSQIGPIRRWSYSDPKIREFVPDCQGEVYEAEFDCKEGAYDPASGGVEQALWKKLGEMRGALRGNRLRGLVSSAMRWYCRDAASALYESITKSDGRGALNTIGKLLTPLVDEDVKRVLAYRPEHKLDALERIFRDHDFNKAVVFTDRVSLADLIAGSFPELNPVKLIGIRRSSQREREEALKKAQGEARLIIGTSAAEEGIDLPTVDLLIVWSNVSSEIRFVQRFGRLLRKSRMPVKFAVFLTTPKTYDHDSFCKGLRKFRSYLTRETGEKVDILNMDIPWESSTAARLITELKEKGIIAYEDYLEHAIENGYDEKEIEQGFRYLLWSGLAGYFTSLRKCIFYENDKPHINLLLLPSKRARVYYHVDQADEISKQHPEDFDYDSEVKLDISYRRTLASQPEYFYWITIKDALGKLVPLVQDGAPIYELRAFRDWPGFVNLDYYYIKSERVLRRCLENAYSVASHLKRH